MLRSLGYALSRTGSNKARVADAGPKPIRLGEWRTLILDRFSEIEKLALERRE